MRKRLPCFPIVLAAAACGGDEIDLPVPADLSQVAETDAQQAPAGARLPAALAVIVRASDGAIVPRAEVEWSVVAGDGAAVSDPVTLSDGTGRAEVVFRLGSAPGEYRVRAALANRPEVRVEFSATATDPPSLSAVLPATFEGGDTLTLEGDALGEGVRVEIAGTPARVLSVAADGRSLRTVAPICLDPGEVEIRAAIDLAVSNALVGTYESSGEAVRLAVGEYASLEPAAVGGCATFPAAGGDGAEYLFAPQSVTGAAGRSASFRLAGTEVITVVSRPPRPRVELPFAVRFHDDLRRRERELAQVPKPPPGAALAPLAPAGPSLGDRRTFRVCNIVTCSTVEDFERVVAEVKFVGEHAVIYQDVNAPAGGFAPEDFRSLGEVFDRDLYEVNARAFGAESDVDQNGLVVILMTPVVNGLTPREECEDAFITGFFFAIDIDPSFQNDERSNQAEVFYTLAPDPEGTVSCEHTADRVRRLVPVTFIHEHQHMINYTQHVLIRGSANAEAIWLNEAMSHLAEELGGFHFLELGDEESFSRFVIGDLFNAFEYLKDPGAEFALWRQGTGSLEERGAAWLFLRWIVDQFGDAVIRRLSETAATGAGNVEQATGESLDQLLPMWFLANYVADLPGFEAPRRLRYTTWAFRTTYASLNEQAPNSFDRPFPIVPDSAQGGTFELLGVLRSGSGEYFRVLQEAAQPGFTLEFTDEAGEPIDPEVAPRLNVVRVR